jgi:PAS domain-containing protein
VHEEILLSDLCKPEDMALLKLQWQSLITGRPTAMSMRFRDIGGDEGKWVQVACVPVLNDSSEVISVTGCITDINAQKKVEQETVKRAEALEKLHLSEARLLNFIANAPLGIAIFDQNKFPLFVNDTWIQLTGHSPVPAGEVDVRSVIYPEDLPMFDDCLDQLSKGENLVGIHIRLNCLWNGGTKSLSYQTWVSLTAFKEEIDGNAYQITTTMTDISDLKFTESIQCARLEEAVEARRQQEK